MCGEHRNASNGKENVEGSSPHVRGALLVAVDQADDRGIIPACAGSTPCRNNRASADWDHPRMCGEHAAVRNAPEYPSGSSPHVRGALGYDGKVFVRWGIIPACAGSTGPVCRIPSARRDHPRMCGEHRNLAPRGKTGRGSSPHVRGAQDGKSA